MPRKISLVIGAILIAVLAARPLYFRPLVYVTSLHEAANRIKQLNYGCYSDVRSGLIGNGFMVSKEPATWNDANALCKTGRMDASWTNKIWIAPLRTVGDCAIPDDAGTRVWGRVFAFGDPAFLDEIERRLAWNFFSFGR